MKIYTKVILFFAAIAIVSALMSSCTVLKPKHKWHGGPCNQNEGMTGY